MRFEIIVKDNVRYKSAYGKLFKITTPDWKIENYFCFNRKIESPLPRHIHFKNCIELQFPDKFLRDYKSSWNYWIERMFYALYDNPGKVTSFMSGANSGKTTFGSLFAINWYLYKPTKRAVVVSSTTEAEANVRIWGDIFDMYTKLVNDPANEVQGHFVNKPGIAILWDKKSSLKHGLHLRPLKNKDAEASLKGFHLDEDEGGNLYIFDECNELDLSLLRAIPNILRGRGENMVLAIANSSDYENTHSQLSEPLTGWGNQHPDRDFRNANKPDSEYWWETKYGVAHWFDCYMSPYIAEPEREELSYLFSNKIIKEKIREYGESSSQFWRQVRGYPMEFETALYVLTRSMIDHSKAKERAVFRERPILVASLDPAFTSGGDTAKLRFGNYGLAVNGIHTLQLVETLDIKPQSDTEFNHLLVEEVVKECQKRNVNSYNFSLDASGGGGIVLAELFRKHKSSWGKHIHLTTSLGNPSDKFIDSTMQVKASERFSNRSSELVMMIRYFVQGGQIKNLDDPTIDELLKRQYKEVGNKIKIQNKQEYKKVLGKSGTNYISPDNSDALAVMISLLSDRFGFIPVIQSEEELKKKVIEKDITEDSGIELFLPPSDYGAMGFDYD